MVLELVRFLLCDRFGCPEEAVELATSFDDLNIHYDELTELVVAVGERFNVDIPDRELDHFAFVEDLVGYVEDHLE